MGSCAQLAFDISKEITSQVFGLRAPAADMQAGLRECVVCLDVLEVPVVTPCNHWFCKVRMLLFACMHACSHVNYTQVIAH